jgi:prolyl oligopeptidase
MLKHYKVVFLFIISSLVINAQDTTWTYFNAKWKETSKDSASFYRKKYSTDDKTYNVCDYYISGKIQMTGSYTKQTPEEKEGKFTYYYENGQKSAEGNYSNGKETGVWRRWYKTGELHPASAELFTGAATDTIWGKIVNDPYRWMENISSDKTKQWLNDQKKLTEGYNQKIFSSMKKHLNYYSYVDFKPIFSQGNYYFSYRFSDRREAFSLYFGKQIYDDFELLFDPNKLYSTHTTGIDKILLSKDNKTLALVLKKNGGDWKNIRFLNMDTHKLTDDSINFVKYSNICWFNQGLFYSKYDVKSTEESFSGTIKGQALYYHKLGTNQKEDLLVYKPENEFSDVDFEVTPEEKYLILYRGSSEDKKVMHKISCVELNSALTFNFKDVINLETKQLINFSVLGVLSEKLLVQSNFGALNGAIYSYDAKGTNIKGVFVPGYGDVQLENAIVFGNKLLTVYNNDSSSYAVIRDSTGKILKAVTIPPGYTFKNFSYSVKDNQLIFSFYSFFCPPSVYQYDLTTYKFKPLGETYINFETKDFITRKVYYYSKDSTRVPMYLTYKKNLKLDGNNPVLLYGYGGFGVRMEPFYDAANVAFMKAGGILAAPCLRGGGDFPGWHEQGMGLKKQNTFDDFIAAAEYLISNKYTNSTKMAAMGGSNGGLVVGAVMVQRPDLFKAVVAESGVFEMLRYHLYNIGYGYTREIGNIEDSLSFVNLLSYSPVHNVKKGVNYPAILLVASDNDDRVNPFNSFKFLAELQNKGTGTNPYLLYYEENAGHSGSIVYDKWAETRAYIYSFIFKQLGMEKKIKYW